VCALDDRKRMNSVRSLTSTRPPGRGYLAGIIMIGALLVAALGLLAIDRTMRATALEEATQAAKNEAAILAAGLESELDKFSLVPLVLARDPQVQSLLAGDPAQRAGLNQRLEQIAKQTGTAVIYLMDRDGLTLAASNWNEPDSFVGSTYGFRRYFRDARTSGMATEFALGTVSRRPGLYVARRVDAASGPLGVVAIKVEFNPLEANWAKAKLGVYVTDPEGVVLVTSNPAWRFSTTKPIAPGERDAEQDLRQFGKAALPRFNPNVNTATALPPALIESVQPVKPLDWNLHLLSDPSTSLAAAEANGRLLFLLLLVLAIAIAALVAIGVRRREARAEALLSERTGRLRDQLQQANRLATLGQITAGVGHEIRQPVAAIRILAETGERLGERGAHDEATANFSRIAALTERIGSITDELRRFSRRGDREPRQVPLRQVIDGALLLLGDRVTQLAIDLALPPEPMQDLIVRGEHVALEQVLVNLLQNAFDATGKGGKVSIDINESGQFRKLSVSDNGAGLTTDQRASLFQPFATTKPDGLGLGLVISQDIMRGLGGDLLEEPVPVGTRFTMLIPGS
jgi:two-component system, NtrC family, C4-dicarboxylate transport sensor histidine kinase DctB